MASEFYTFTLEDSDDPDEKRKVIKATKLDGATLEEATASLLTIRAKKWWEWDPFIWEVVARHDVSGPLHEASRAREAAREEKQRKQDEAKDRREWERLRAKYGRGDSE